MNRLPIISISGSNNVSPIQCPSDKSLLRQVAGEKDVPWWEHNNTEPSGKYFIYVFDPTEVGKSNPFGQEKKLFRLVKFDGHREVTIDEGEIRQEKLMKPAIGNGPWERQIAIEGKKLICFFITTPDYAPTLDPLPKTVGKVDPGFKALIDQLVAKRQ